MYVDNTIIQGAAVFDLPPTPRDVFGMTPSVLREPTAKAEMGGPGAPFQSFGHGAYWEMDDGGWGGGVDDDDEATCAIDQARRDMPELTRQSFASLMPASLSGRWRRSECGRIHGEIRARGPTRRDARRRGELERREGALGARGFAFTRR